MLRLLHALQSAATLSSAGHGALWSSGPVLLVHDVPARVLGLPQRPALSTPLPTLLLAGLQVNVDTDEMRELGQGMQVSHLPWFHLFLAGDLRASFSANVTSVATLRAEIAANKSCTDPGCDVY